MKRDIQIQIIAKHLAHLYGGPVDRICSCDSVCNNLDCSIWWEGFLKNYDSNDIKKMVELFKYCQSNFRD